MLLKDDMEVQDRLAAITNMPATMPIREDFTLGRFISSSCNIRATTLD